MSDNGFLYFNIVIKITNQEKTKLLKLNQVMRPGLRHGSVWEIQRVVECTWAELMLPSLRSHLTCHLTKPSQPG